MEDHIEHQQEVLQLLKDNLNLAKNLMTQQEDQHRSKRIFDVRDDIFMATTLQKNVTQVR